MAVLASAPTGSSALINEDLTLDPVNGYYEQEAFLTPNYTMDIEVADFDKDGCKDAALAIFYNKQQKMFWGNCDGTWTETDLFGVRTGWGIDSADINNDGYPDIVLGTYPNFGGPSGNYLYLNNRDRTFAGSVMFGNANTTNLHAQDINSDGLPDVVVPVAGQCRLYINNGDGTFTSQNLLSAVNTMNLNLFDLDKDGDLDVMKSEYSGNTTYNLKNSDGSYTTNNVTTTTVSDMQPIDFDKDSDWDFTVANNGQNYLYVNNGNGTWSRANQFGSRQSNVHNIRDIDGNGYDDIIVGNGAWGTSQQNYIYYNNGNGTFTETAAFGTGSTYTMQFADIDGDGDEDVVSGNWTANGNRIFYNGYYSTTSKNISIPVVLSSDFAGWEYLDMTETVPAGTGIQYSIYPEDTNNDDVCNDGSVLLGPESSSNGQVDISSVAGVPICVFVALTSNRAYATPKVTELNIVYAADSVSPTGLRLLSPSGYTKDEVKPTFVFKKAADAGSGLAAYSLTLDSGKANSYTVSGIPATGNILKSSYVWKDDSSVKVEFFNENDTDSSNDEIHVYFKDFNTKELAEGKHSWIVTAYDNADNSQEESLSFFIDKTNPSISDVAISMDAIHLPVFSGTASDKYFRSNDDYEKVSSGPKTLNLLIQRKDHKGDFLEYVRKDYELSDIIDLAGAEKRGFFSVKPSLPLDDGFYEVYLTLKDVAGNTYSNSVITYPVNYVEPTEKAERLLTQLKTEVIKSEEIPARTEREKKEVKEDGVTVQIKVLDKEGNPVEHARVELHSDPLITYTDKNGIAKFNDVPFGEHTVKIAYDNYEGEQKISLIKENTKQFNFDIKVTEKVKTPLSINVYFPAAAILLICLISFGVFLFLIKRGKLRKRLL